MVKTLLRQDNTVEIELRAVQRQIKLLSGQPTSVWTYEARRIRGDVSIKHLDSFVGPVIRVRRGQRFIARFINQISETTTVHWHGLNVPEHADGHPKDSVPPGGQRVYEFEIINRAGTYWFHPHPDMRTGRHVWNGLAGMLIVHDDEEPIEQLDDVEEMPIILQDRTFNASNQIVYSIVGMEGALGNRILVNGRPNYAAKVTPSCYRLRILNGSNTRIYKLAFDNMPMVAIGTDGGLLHQAVEKPYIALAPGERVDLWVDFSRFHPGQSVPLRSLPFSATGIGQGPLPNGAGFEVMRFDIRPGHRGYTRLPRPIASKIPTPDQKEAVNYTNPRALPISFDRGRFLLNGAAFRLTEVASNERVRLKDTEVWTFANTTGTMIMPHPIHLHGPSFRVLERTIQNVHRANWEAMREGYTDEGWKDTILLMPGESAKILINFGPYDGLFLYHCHMLEHEDQGMMRNYLVYR